MATQGTYLVNNTTNDVLSLLQQLQAVRTTTTRIAERMQAIGEGALDTYPQWPEGYTKGDFIDLYNALNGLPSSIVSNDVRNKLFKLVSFIQ